jgi:membrane-associated phospholipid phosphatase
MGFAPLLLLYVIYTLVRWTLADRGPRVGPANAERLLDWQASTGLDWELGIQGFALDRHWLVIAANWYYVYAFLPVLLAGAVLAIWRAPTAFTTWRRVFTASLALALAGFALYPVAPPRLLPGERGFVDTLMLHGPRYYGDAEGSSLFNGYGRLPSMVNEYAALPSMHVAWSAVAGILIAAAIGRRWALIVPVLHTMVMAFTVIATGNHYVSDVIGGLIVLAASVVACEAHRRTAPSSRRAATPATIRMPRTAYGD